ncbi:MAG: hypothetical protein GXO54_04680 [Chloroflexi bacterium]|nr:hypothetical protein [Chloroflexota bacterium]
MGAWRAWWRRAWAWFQGFLYGMLFYDMERALRRQRADLEDLFMFIVFGDMIGLPVLPPYYSLRLLPYIVPVVNRWKRRVLRERDLTDLVADLDG